MSPGGGDSVAAADTLEAGGGAEPYGGEDENSPGHDCGAGNVHAGTL